MTPGRAKGPLTRDLERLALHYAIEERLGFLDSMGTPATDSDRDAVDRARALVAGWRAIMKRRYSPRP
jgi:hypothetical protein